MFFLFLYVLISLGNHEFDEGIGGLSPFIRNLTSPVLSANIILDNVPELQQEKNLHKSITMDINGVKVGIVGYLTPDTQFLADRTNVQYIEEVLALKKEVKVLQNQGTQIIIALGHSGYIKDKEIARDVEGLDLVIGGHSNTFLWNGTCPDAETINGPYPTMVKQKSGRMVPVVQAYAYTKYLGRLLLTFNSKGEITRYSGTPLLLDHTVPQDPEVLKIINYYSVEMARITEEIVGSSMVLLNGDCRLRECNIGNIITDAMVEYYVSHYRDRKNTNVPIAIIQGGRIRASITHAGTPMTLTRGDWISVLPFSGNLVTLTMNGTVLLKALEHAVVSWRLIDRPGQFLQWSGMEVVYDVAKPMGSRVSKALARCAKCKSLEQVTEEKIYNIMMPTFIAEGGDGFTMFDDKSLPLGKLPYAELNCVYKYLSDHSPVSPGLTGRIKILNEDKVSYEKSSAKTLELSLVSLFILICTVL